MPSSILDVTRKY